jgi:hypothetical protein
MPTFGKLMTDLRKYIADHEGDFPNESIGHPGRQLAEKLRRFCQHSDTTKEQLSLQGLPQNGRRQNSVAFLRLKF